MWLVSGLSLLLMGFLQKGKIRWNRARLLSGRQGVEVYSDWWIHYEACGPGFNIFSSPQSLQFTIQIDRLVSDSCGRKRPILYICLPKVLRELNTNPTEVIILNGILIRRVSQATPHCYIFLSSKKKLMQLFQLPYLVTACLVFWVISWSMVTIRMALNF